MLVPLSLFAQSPESASEQQPEIPPGIEIEPDEPVLIADVNFRGVSTSSEDGTTVVVFALENSYGQQDGITYGVEVRSRQTGDLLMSIVGNEAISLREDEKRELQFVYTAPDRMTENAEVILSAYNREGLPLAFQSIDTIAANPDAASCEVANDIVTCSADEPVVAQLAIRAGTPQGAVIVEKTMAAATEQTINLIDYISPLEPGRYVALVNLSDQSTAEIVGTFATDFTKDGEYAKLLSVSPLLLEGGQLEVVTYAEVGYLSGTEPLELSVGLGTCAAAQELAFDEPVKKLTFTTDCESGDVVATLSVGDRVLDTLTVPFGERRENAADSSPDNSEVVQGSGANDDSSSGYLVLLILGMLLILGAFIWYVAHRKPPEDTTVPPTMIILVLTLVGYGLTLQSAEAATYSFTSAPDYNTCVVGSGMGCAEPDTAPGASRSITVVVPDSVPQGSVYTVQYNARVNNSTGATCSGSPCTAANNLVEVYDGPLGPGMGWVGVHLVTTYNTLPAGYHGSRASITRPLLDSSGQTTAVQNFNKTASSTGTQETLSFLVGVGGSGVPVSSCTYSYCLTHPYSKVTVVVNLTAANTAPTANAGANRSITLPTDTVTISGASATDSDGTIASRNWTRVSGPVVATIANGTTLTPTFSGMTTAGTYVFRLTVTDNNGATDTDDMQVVVAPAASSCDWTGTTYLGLNTGNPGMHNTTRCTTPAPSDGTPSQGYCNNVAEDGSTVVCCDSGADCYRYTCDFKASCSVPVVDLNFQ